MSTPAITCFNCRSPVIPRKRAKCTRRTHIVALMLLPLLLCFIPYIVDIFKKIRYECPVCGTLIIPVDESKWYFRSVGNSLKMYF